MIDLSIYLAYTGYSKGVRNVEAELIEELENTMRKAGKTQAEFAAFKGVSRQSVHPYFNGKRGLLTDTARDLFDFLGVRIRLEPIDHES